MKINQIIFKIGIGLLMLTMIGCIIISYVIRLDNPVFLKNCIETPAASSEAETYNLLVLQLQYITNSNDDRSVVGISFDEAPKMEFTATESYQGGFIYYNNSVGNTQGNNIGRYNLRTVYVYMNNYFQEYWEGEVELHTANIQFNNGDTYVADLGKIIIFSDRVNDRAISQSSSSNSSDGTSITRYTVNYDITLLNMESPLLDSITDLVELKVEDRNYDDISGMKFVRRNTIDISSKFSDIQGKVTAYDNYDIKPKLNYENAEGTTQSIRHGNIWRQRYFNEFKDVLKYLIGRGAF